MAQFDYLVDVENRRLVSSFLSTRAASSPSFVIGDQPTIAVRLVRGNSNNPNQPWQYVEPSATQSIRIAVGNLGGAPTAGSFVMSFGGDDTIALPYDATGDEVGLALNVSHLLKHRLLHLLT